MHIGTTGHILFCLVAIAQARAGSLSKPLANPPSQDLKVHGQRKILSGKISKVKHKGSMGQFSYAYHDIGSEQVATSSRKFHSHLPPVPEEEDLNKDIIVLFFTESDDTGPTVDSASVDDARSSNLETSSVAPPPADIDYELYLIFRRFRTETLHINRPFRFVYRNRLHFNHPVNVQMNIHWVNFWGEGVTGHCTRRNEDCLLIFERRPRHVGRDAGLLATMWITEGMTVYYEWRVPLSIREEVLEVFGMERLSNN
ncbi:hypothetical protein F5880DRAFT_1501746 [Lentinula raphanica]|nr:hypothetical protein F5880DRAFT_1501746 [Lentinula raphanica]